MFERRCSDPAGQDPGRVGLAKHKVQAVAYERGAHPAIGSFLIRHLVYFRRRTDRAWLS
jgi:hypothetical protein